MVINDLLPAIVQRRVNGGTNLRFAAETGVVQGRVVGQMINALPFKKE